MHRAHGLAGRGTSVFYGTAALAVSQSSGQRGPTDDATTASKTSEKLREVTVKFYWQEKSRLGVLGKSNNHLARRPDLLFAHDFPEYSTGYIRKMLGLGSSEHQSPTRIPRLAVFSRPRPVTALVGEAFLKAWFDCVRGVCFFGLVSTTINAEGLRPLCSLGAGHPGYQAQVVESHGR